MIEAGKVTSPKITDAMIRNAASKSERKFQLEQFPQQSINRGMPGQLE